MDENARLKQRIRDLETEVELVTADYNEQRGSADDLRTSMAHLYERLSINTNDTRDILTILSPVRGVEISLRHNKVYPKFGGLDVPEDDEVAIST
jgi:hypothetical protein